MPQDILEYVQVQINIQNKLLAPPNSNFFLHDLS